MAVTTTPNLGLMKPDYDELADIDVINDNMDIIDAAVGGKTVVNTDLGTTTLSNNTAKSCGSITFQPGVWLVVAGYNFAASTTGVRAFSVATTPDQVANSRGLTRRVQAPGAGACVEELVVLLNMTSNTIYHFNANQNSGGDLDVSVYVRQIKLN